MTKDEFETLERYTRELEALKYYPQVKGERDSLATEVAQLREKVALLGVQLENEASARKELSSRLSKREAEVIEVAAKLDEAQRDLSSLRDFKAKLPKGKGLTLEKMQKQFLRAQAKEIEARTKEGMEDLAKEMHSQMPVLVQKELIRVLNSPNWPPEIEKVVSLQARRIADEALRNKGKWPQWFKDYYLQQVKEAVAKGLDSEFEDKVKAEAQKRLEAMKTGQWERYSAAKAKELAVNLRTAVSELQGTRWFTCDKCRRRLGIEIGPSEIGQLLGQKTVDIMCSACLDLAPPPFFLSVVPHKVGSLTLAGLLQLYLGGTPSAG